MGEPVPVGSGQPDAYVATIGDINISRYWVSTPSGQYPIRGTTWAVADMTHWREGVSPAGVVLCIIFIWFCLLGLLFLLLKDRTITGYVQVTVQGNGFHHSTLIPAVTGQTVWQVNQSVNYARSLAAAA